MPILLPLLDVLFVGLVGTDPGHIDRQIVQAENRLKVKKVTVADAKALANNDDTSIDVVKKLGADGVVVGQLVTQSKRSHSLRVVIYNSVGTMTSMSELPLGVRRMLNKDDLAVLKSNLNDEVTSLLAAKDPGPKKKGTAVAAKTQISASDDLASAPSSSNSSASLGADLASGGGDDDDPLGKKPQQAKPTQTAAADSGDSSGDANQVKASSGDTAASAGKVRDLIGADLGVGVVSRSFDPGPSTVRGYGAGTIPEAHLDVIAHPFAHATAAFAFERTLGMETVLEGDTNSQAVSSDVQRWELTAQYAVIHGKVDVAPMVGIGSRDFSASTTAMDRSPDASYTYAIVGGIVTYPVTPKLVLHGSLAFEPMVGGAEPTISLVGASTRWGLDVGIAAEYYITDRIYTRAALDYQRIEWSWNAQNMVPAGTALDSYPTGTIAVGARY
jgi:hypothetical protein